MNKKENFKKILEWNVQRHKRESKKCQSKYLFIFSLHSNEVKKFKTANGIR